MNTRNLLTSFFFFLSSLAGFSQPLEGRWDINVNMNGKMVPSWLEVKHSGLSTLVGRIMLLSSGSARPISKINYDNGKFSFSIPQQWVKSDINSDIDGQVTGDSLKGTLKYLDGKTYSWTGGRSPNLIRSNVPEWGAPVKLFNGKDISGWHATGTNQWIVEGGILRSPVKGSNLVTDQKFTDFKLHFEVRYPKYGNSGFYLRSRYEIQVADSKGMEPDDIQFGAIYGLLPPNEMVAKDAGEWQTFEVTLIGRRVTVVANGFTVINDQIIPGITGGALDCNEGEPGPFMIQGDHVPVDYRNIIVTPVK